MSVDTHRAGHPDPTRDPKAQGAASVTRVILGSLFAGAVTALVLTAVVFPGATESVITGSTLLAFGIGWTMMAVLSTRRTRQPQRWAAVPAVAMSATGAALLVLTPQNDTLTALQWVWPPVMLTLAVWMYVQMRRALTGRGRWLLTPVLVTLAVASVGATMQNIDALRVADHHPAQGLRYAVGDHELHLDCYGRGGPTLVLFNGLGEISTSWTRITDAMGGTTRVCAYDRAGQGWSDDAAAPQDAVTAAEDLHGLMAAAGEEGPYILVGHSTGGPYAMTYAAQYPEHVAGMVLLDSSSPQQLTEIPSYAGQYAVMRRGLALLPTLSRLGLGGVVTASSHLPAEAAERVEAMGSTPRAARNQRDEVSMIPEVFEQAQSLTTLRDLPLVVLTASETLDTEGWAAAQDRLAALSTNHVHRDVDSTHGGLLEDQPGAAESVRAITDVVTAARTGAPLATP